MTTGSDGFILQASATSLCAHQRNVNQQSGWRPEWIQRVLSYIQKVGVYVYVHIHAINGPVFPVEESGGGDAAILLIEATT